MRRLASLQHHRSERHPRSCGRVILLVAGVAHGCILEEAQPPTWPVAPFGLAVASLPDIDGDGSPEIVVASPRSTGRDEGLIVAVSAGDGRRLWTVPGSVDAFDPSLRSIRRVSDLSGDGVPDLAVAIERPESAGSPGREVRVLSGLDGETLRVLRPETPDLSPRFAQAIAPVGDVDRDGTEDLAVSDIVTRADGVPVHAVVVFSGRTGLVLRRLVQPGPLTGSQPNSIHGIGDWDGRGTGDIAVGTRAAAERESVLVHAGEDGRLIRVFQDHSESRSCSVVLLPWPTPSGRTGQRLMAFLNGYHDASGDPAVEVSAVDDSSGDLSRRFDAPPEAHDVSTSPTVVRGPGGRVLLVAAWTHWPAGEDHELRVSAVDPDAGRIVWSTAGPDPATSTGFGIALSALDDVDGDGWEEVIVGEPEYRHAESPGSPPRGRVCLVSGRTGWLLRAFGPGGAEAIRREDVSSLFEGVGSADLVRREESLRRARAIRLADVALLLPALQSESELAVRAAVALLRCLGPQAGPAVPIARERLEAQSAARRAGQTSTQSDAIMLKICALLGDDGIGAWISDTELAVAAASLPSIEMQAPLIDAMARRRAPIGDVLASLRRHLDAPDAPTRTYAAESLAKFQAPANGAAAHVRQRVLEMCMSDSDPLARRAASTLAEAWTIEVSSGLQPLVALLKSPVVGRTDDEGGVPIVVEIRRSAS